MVPWLPGFNVAFCRPLVTWKAAPARAAQGMRGKYTKKQRPSCNQPQKSLTNMAAWPYI